MDIERAHCGNAGSAAVRARRSLILGAYKAQRIVAALRQRGIDDITVCSRIDPRSESSMGNVDWVPMSVSFDASDMVRIVRTLQPGVVLTTVQGDEEEHLVLEYALAAAEVGDPPFGNHPHEFARLCTDKVAFQLAADRLGIPVPSGVVCATVDDLEGAIAASGGHPVMVKAARAHARQGIHLVPNEAARRALLAAGALTFPAVVQQAVHGEELGLEVVSGPNPRRFPVISMGELDDRCDPFNRVRSAPRLLPEATAAELERVVEVIEAEFRPKGAWQLDLALVGDRLLVLEVNGRLGGLSDLGWATCGVDPHAAACDQMLGLAPPVPRPSALALEIPIRPGADLPVDERGITVRIARSSATNPGMTAGGNERLMIASADASLAGEWIGRLSPEVVLPPFETVHRQFVRAAAGLAAGR